MQEKDIHALALKAQQLMRNIEEFNHYLINFAKTAYLYQPTVFTASETYRDSIFALIGRLLGDKLFRNLQ